MSDWKGQRWEYHIARKTQGPMDDGQLDEFGAWGWELVAIAEFKESLGAVMVYTFKRPVQQAKIELP